ncbi:MAG: efflux RND transporter periplasmic adaptor subunit [Phycisphaerales bacterium]|nr:efflux RND transporter periplasmic adaptor subunit [Phycisphaerales bacterium]
MSTNRSFIWRLIPVFVRGGVALLVVIVSLGVFFALMSQRVDPERTEAIARGIPVRTIVAAERPVPRVWEGYGTVRAMNASTVSAQISGRVVERPAEVEAGLPINKGDTIVRLETIDTLSRVNSAEASIASYQAQLASLDVQESRVNEQIDAARAELEIERRNEERVQQAARDGAGNQADLDNASSAVRRAERTLATLEQQLDVIPARRDELTALQASARSSLTQAQEDFSRTTISAPMSGVLQDVFVRPGELLSIGQQVARVVDLRRLEVPLRVPVSAGSTVRIGDSATLRSDGPVPHEWAGKVGRIAPEADAMSRTMIVYIEVNQDPETIGIGEALLLPGQFVVGSISTSDERPMVLVPRRAVSGDRVFAVSDETGEGHHRVVPIDVQVSHYIRGSLPEIEPAEREWAVIESGLNPGSRVIISNLDELVGGMMIDPTGGSERAGGGS